MRHRAIITAFTSALLLACGDRTSGNDPTSTTLADSASVTADDVAADSTVPSTVASPNSANNTRHDTSTIVRTGMQNVNMHIENGIVLAIKHLRGTILPTRKGAPPALNSKQSMLINIESADILIDTTSLANMLNRYVFGYPNSPLRNLHVSIDGDEMIQTGSMKKGVWWKFRIRGTMSLTPENEIRVHPTKVSVAGVGVTGLSKSLGGMSKLIKLEPGHGARLDGDDFILSPTEMLPPPKIRGKLSSIKLEPGGVRQTFGTSGESKDTDRRKGSTANNFMYFHGGTLRFGKLTMNGTDLEIVDGDQSNPFDYALDRYQEHLVAGHSNTTNVDGLIVVMPDLQKLGQTKTKNPEPAKARGSVR